MRFRKREFPKFRRTIRKFIWFPTKREIWGAEQETQEWRWMEWAWVVQAPYHTKTGGICWLTSGWTDASIDFEERYRQAQEDYEAATKAGRDILPPPEPFW